MCGCLWPQGEISALCPSQLFCPLPTQQRVANGFLCAGALSALYSSSASSALKNRVVFQLRFIGNTWVCNMECISSLVVPTVTSSLLGKTLVSMVSIYSWTYGKLECQTFFAQIFESHVVQKMVQSNERQRCYIRFTCEEDTEKVTKKWKR